MIYSEYQKVLFANENLPGITFANPFVIRRVNQGTFRVNIHGNDLRDSLVVRVIDKNKISDAIYAHLTHIFKTTITIDDNENRLILLSRRNVANALNISKKNLSNELIIWGEDFNKFLSRLQFPGLNSEGYNTRTAGSHRIDG